MVADFHIYGIINFEISVMRLEGWFRFLNKE